VVTLGRHSMSRFMPGTTISRAHGTTAPVDPATGAATARVLAMYHPAAALRAAAVETASFVDAALIPAALLEARRLRAPSTSATLAPAPPDAGPAPVDAPPQPSETDQLTLFT
jgi:DNA polymerase